MGIGNISGLLGNLITSELMKTNADLLQAYERLSTGKRINSASDDAAGLAISSRLEAQARGLAQAEQNAQMGISMVQTAEGYLDSVTQDVQRINELSVQAANGTLTNVDRQAIQAEINQLQENIDFNLNNAEFNNKKLFSGTTQTFQIDPSGNDNMTLDIPSMTAASIGVGSIDVTTQTGAETAITQSQDALNNVLEVRTELGASQNRLESTINSLSQTRIDTLSSLSQIQDANMVEEVLNASQLSQQLEAQLMVAAQVKNLEGGLLKLLL